MFKHLEWQTSWDWLLNPWLEWLALCQSRWAQQCNIHSPATSEKVCLVDDRDQRRMSRILLNSNYSNSNSNKQLLQSRASLNAKPQEVQTIISKMYLIKCTVSVNSKHVAVKIRTIVFLFVFFVIIICIGWSNVNSILNFKMKYKPLPKVVQVKTFGWFNLSTYPFFHPLQCATLHCWCYLHVFNGNLKAIEVNVPHPSNSLYEH